MGTFRFGGRAAAANAAILAALERPAIGAQMQPAILLWLLPG